MNEPPWYLLEYVEDELTPLGFKEYEDYVFAYEQLVSGPRRDEDTLVNKPIPGCENISWLESRVTRQGNFVWHACF